MDWLLPPLKCEGRALPQATARAMRAWHDLRAVSCSLSGPGQAHCHAAFDLVQRLACDTHQRPGQRPHWRQFLGWLRIRDGRNLPKQV